MTTWAEGQLKVRGKVRDFKRWASEGLLVSDYDSNYDLRFFKPDMNNPFINSKSSVKIKGMTRAFIDDFFLSFYEEDDDEDKFEVFRFRQPGHVDTKELAKISKKYNLDMKIYACQNGGEFNQDIEIIAGRILKNQDIYYDDYWWESPFPLMGG